jgi:hypothetical protein
MPFAPLAMEEPRYRYRYRDDGGADGILAVEDAQDPDCVKLKLFRANLRNRGQGRCDCGCGRLGRLFAVLAIAFASVVFCLGTKSISIIDNDETTAVDGGESHFRNCRSRLGLLSCPGTRL